MTCSASCASFLACKAEGPRCVLPFCRQARAVVGRAAAIQFGAAPAPTSLSRPTASRGGLPSQCADADAVRAEIVMTEAGNSRPRNLRDDISLATANSARKTAREGRVARFLRPSPRDRAIAYE